MDADQLVDQWREGDYTLLELVQQLAKVSSGDVDVKKQADKFIKGFDEVIELVHKKSYFKAFNSELGKTMAKLGGNSEIFHAIVKKCVQCAL